MNILRNLRRLKHKLKKKPLLFVRQILADVGLIGIDVGAAYGLQPHWWTFHGAAQFYTFEPHPESCEALKKIYSATEFPELYNVLPDALSGSGGMRTLYKLNVATGSSLLPINLKSDEADPGNSYIFPIETEEIQTKTLLESVTENRIPRVDMIKLDVQGTELEILKGLGEEHLNELLLVELEIGFGDVYIGAPTFSDIETFMQSKGLKLFDVSVARAYRGKNGNPHWYQEKVFGVYGNSPKISARLWEFDAVYFRDAKILLANKNGNAIRRLIICYCAYNFFADAYNLVEQSEDAEIFSKEQTDELKRQLVAWHKKLHYRFYHKPTWLFNKMRKFQRRYYWGSQTRWKQYMWFDYPNG